MADGSGAYSWRAKTPFVPLEEASYPPIVATQHSDANNNDYENQVFHSISPSLPSFANYDSQLQANTESQLQACHDSNNHLQCHPGSNNALVSPCGGPPSNATGSSCGPDMTLSNLDLIAPASPQGTNFEDADFLSQTSSQDEDNGQLSGPNLAAEADPSAESRERMNASGQESEKEKRQPWSELKTKAGKERKRLPLACIACRRKKIRCSGEKPACKHCSRSRIPCIYKVTTRKAAPRTDYMVMLDRRLKRMEERVIKAIPKGETRDMAAIGRGVVKPAVPGQSAKFSKLAHKKRSADEAFAQIEEWISGNRKPLHDLYSLRREPKLSEGNGLLSEGGEFLPTAEIQEHLAEVFFDCIYGQSFLLLHKPSFMRRLKSRTMAPVLVLAVCAVSARFSTHPRLKSEPAFLRGENWADPAAAIALSRHDEPNITILTVFLLLGLHEFGTCHGGRSWSFCGQAVRMAYALQLHKEPSYDQAGQNGQPSELSPTDKEIRRRIMWACFMMDKFTSSGTQRPPSKIEDFLEIQLPIKESHFLLEISGPTEDLDGNVPSCVVESQGQLSNPKGNMGVFAYIIKAIALWGRIVEYLNLGNNKQDPHHLWDPESGYSFLKRQIAEFTASLPYYLSFTLENLQNHNAEKIANQFLFLHIIIHQNMLFLNQFAIPLAPGGRPPKDMPKSFLLDAGRAAVEAAHHISMLIEHAPHYFLTAPFAGYCAYSASTVHIWGIFSKNPQLEARSKESLRHTLKYLNKTKKYWGMFHYMVESAKDRYRQFANATDNTSLANPISQSAMFQYGDWFNKYPHGVRRGSWEDSDINTMKDTSDEAVMGQQPDHQSVEEFFASLSPVQKSRVPCRPQREREMTDGSDNQSQGRISQQPSHVKSPMQPPQTMMEVSVTNTSPVLETADLSSFSDNPDIYVHDSAQILDQVTFDFNITADHISQLDQRFVYGAYAGVDPTTFPSINTTLAVTNAPDGQTVNSVPSWSDVFASATSDNFQRGAWFLPFNIDPMSVGVGVNPALQHGQVHASSGIVGNIDTFSDSGNLISSYNLGQAELIDMGVPSQVVHGSISDVL